MGRPTNHQILLFAHPDGEPNDGCFRAAEQPAPEPGPGQALVRVRYLSVDPAQRIWMNPGGAYNVSAQLGAPMWSLGVGEVIESQDPDLQVGEMVSGMLGWQEYALVTPAAVAKVPAGIAGPAALGVFGLNGQTAYWGLHDIGVPQAGQTVLISAAAGATGSLVGQLARIAGCRAVGLAGSAEKRAWLLDLGFDVALDYRAPDLADQLDKACPDGIDIYFDNVGGSLLDLALARLALGGRIVLCGAIAAYNDNEWGPGPSQYRQLIRQRGTMRGFIIMDYTARYPEALEKLLAWERQGRLQHREDVIVGLTQAPEALRRVLRGEHFGKSVVSLPDA